MTVRLKSLISWTESYWRYSAKRTRSTKSWQKKCNRPTRKRRSLRVRRLGSKPLLSVQFDILPAILYSPPALLLVCWQWRIHCGWCRGSGHPQNFGLPCDLQLKFVVCEPLQYRCHHSREACFHIRMHRNRLTAGLCQDPLGELTAQLPQTL